MLVLLPALLPGQSSTLTEFPIVAAASNPNFITPGPDGALWFVDIGANSIGRVTTAGAITLYGIPTAGANPWDIVKGPDGALWFTERYAGKIGRITTAGVITEFNVKTAGAHPTNIVAGPDGALWFIEDTVNKIAQITTGGTVTEYPVGPTPSGLAAGPDGALWFTEYGKIGRITTAGVVTDFPGPFNGGPSMTAGPDGALWYTEYGKIGRVTTGGTITEYTVPTPSQPQAITTGPDGALWFTEGSADKIARITTAGAITEYSITPTGSHPNGIALGSDGALWITEYLTGKIGRVLPSGSGTGNVTVTTSQPGLTVTVDGTAYPAPRSFNFASGETHSISVTSPQQGDTGTRYVFASWSDSGAQTHNITVPSSPITYTATMNKQYLLTTAVSPTGAGTITATPSSADGFYNSGVSVQLTAAAVSPYQFSNWSGDLTGATNPQSVTMSAPRTVQANFAVPGTVSAVSVTPGSGTASSQSFTFQFSHSAGYLNLGVVNVLINNGLDARNACYLAYIVPSTTLVLVNDAGDAGGPFAGSLALGSSGTIQNSQCIVALTSAPGNGPFLNLTLNITFKAAFGGNKVTFLAARDQGSGNSNWQPLGVWQVPFTPAGTVVVTGMTPGHVALPSGQSQAVKFAWTDSKGTADFGVLNVLVNNSLDAGHACYLAYLAASNTLLLVNDAGDAGGPYAGSMVLNGGAATIQNSQCSVSAAGSSVDKSGSSLMLTLNLSFKPAFIGNRIVYLAGRDLTQANNSGWQASGTWTVQ
ncbi:MAG TPA: hypothetical protein VGH38_26790 [Bryobacteraceae bacterium]